MTQHARLAEHLEFVREQGLGAVAALAAGGEASFAQDPRVGPWASVIRTDPAFAETYVAQDAGEYRAIVSETAAGLFDRDTVPGPEAEALMQLELPALVVPGNDPAHATSAARYLEECLPQSEYWDVPVEEQTEETAPARLSQFLHMPVAESC
jgi:hypothetical protein